MIMIQNNVHPFFLSDLTTLSVHCTYTRSSMGFRCSDSEGGGHGVWLRGYSTHQFNGFSGSSSPSQSTRTTSFGTPTTSSLGLPLRSNSVNSISMTPLRPGSIEFEIGIVSVGVIVVPVSLRLVSVRSNRAYLEGRTYPSFCSG